MNVGDLFIGDVVDALSAAGATGVTGEVHFPESSLRLSRRDLARGVGARIERDEPVGDRYVGECSPSDNSYVFRSPSVSDFEDGMLGFMRYRQRFPHVIVGETPDGSLTFHEATHVDGEPTYSLVTQGQPPTQ